MAVNNETSQTWKEISEEMTKLTLDAGTRERDYTEFCCRQAYRRNLAGKVRRRYDAYAPYPPRERGFHRHQARRSSLSATDRIRQPSSTIKRSRSLPGLRDRIQEEARNVPESAAAGPSRRAKKGVRSSVNAAAGPSGTPSSNAWVGSNQIIQRATHSSSSSSLPMQAPAVSAPASSSTGNTGGVVVSNREKMSIAFLMG